MQGQTAQKFFAFDEGDVWRHAGHCDSETTCETHARASTCTCTCRRARGHRGDGLRPLHLGGLRSRDGTIQKDHFLMILPSYQYLLLLLSCSVCTHQNVAKFGASVLYHVTSLPPVLLELPERGQLLEVRPTVHWHML